jgi:hypothetical protein
MRRRWFQFRLRTLFAFMVLLCLILGTWSLYSTYFGPYIEADSAVASQPITVRGRFVDFLGDESTVYVVKITKPMADGRPLICQSKGGFAQRHGLWTYDFEAKLGPVEKSGSYTLEVLPLTKGVRATPKRNPRPGVVATQITVMPLSGEQDMMPE